MLPIFESLIQQAPHTAVHISVFYTRISDAPIGFDGVLPGNIVISPGRPGIPRIIASMIKNTCASSRGDPRGLVVGVCGPAGLGLHVREAIGNVDYASRNHVGGIELCEE
jgi:ferric-chelate reductase